ncbi:hypothetical protein LV716_03860 [Flagellimonas sp. HMM57]|uniref:hypothetical protein n=1 Tax=unclassified Flagellimonas TaxID=2644544 RepID=UPI0013D3CE4B|nr:MULTISPECIES: hypothetical protein [unclassified Flagellimonas]UII76933.1 hypothetical protein LV716_03860 [Flagellimonas sp. HMM57]
MKLIRLFSLAILALSLGMGSCSGEDGTNGTDGKDGTDGTDGAVGKDGKDGVGFDELTKYGNVTLTLTGTRPDDIAFEDSADFKFTAVEGEEFSEHNSVEITEDGEDLRYQFNIIRFISAPDDVYQETIVRFSINATNLGEENEDIVSASLSIFDYPVVGNDNKYFVIDDTYEQDGTGIQEFEFSDLNFDSETNNLSFSYNIVVDGDFNDSNNSLEISGSSSLTLLEAIVND